MYLLTLAGISRSLDTLLDVLAIFRTDPLARDIDAREVALSIAGHPIDVTRFNGRLTVRRAGSASRLFLSLIDEIDGAYFRPHFVARNPWEIRREQWRLLYLAFDLAREPLYLFSSDQLAQANEEECRGGRHGLDLFELLQGESQRRFGFQYAGPVFDGRQQSGRHEVHVAYALAAGRPVPQSVLEDYTSLEHFNPNLQWAMPLVSVPELRGGLSVAKLAPLVSVMRHAEQPIDSQNAALLVMLMGLARPEPSAVEVDDLLYAKGVLESYPLPEFYSTPVDVGQPSGRFAEVLRRTLADRRRDARLAEQKKARLTGSISERVFRRDTQMAMLDHGRTTHRFANELARAIQDGDMSYLLSVLDRPDDVNRATKDAVREVFGIKLVGMPAATRRRAIFELAGMDTRQQAEWESLCVSQREARRVAREAARS
ncbi:hypothetical protein [Caballeronia sp. LZ043]|uniref:hypothetical protein n=1 Tax=Caballeronia sp. LZ043 TaxID=3038569 RepID=UPI002857B69E|nr:hypothetical protein [Caballeronia sp. LZ043]MDR5826052.1 hypothetical protein [Caballeronia sp. LZ043]